MKVMIVGIGLIGGSMALDIQSLYPNVTIYAFDANDDNLQQAAELSICHKKAILSDCADADLAIVSIPVDAALSLLPEILNIVSQKTLVLDVGSTKSLICQSLDNHPNRKNFLATHPIAGTEFSGPTAAVHNLFLNKTNILCEIEKTAYKLQERALDLFNKLGMRIRYMDATSHDTHMAYVSHLSHIS
jgi:prephenate dehydrogenase